MLKHRKLKIIIDPLSFLIFDASTLVLLVQQLTQKLSGQHKYLGNVVMKVQSLKRRRKSITNVFDEWPGLSRDHLGGKGEGGKVEWPSPLFTHKL